MTQDQFFNRFSTATFADYRAYLNAAIDGGESGASIASSVRKLDGLGDQELWSLISEMRECSV